MLGAADFGANRKAGCVGDGLRLVGLMAAHQARRRRRCGGTAGVARTHILLARLGQRFLDQFVDEEPGAVVAWFFLRPDDLLELRSEEHTSELQSLMRISYAVFCLKKKNKQRPRNN